MLRKPRIEFPGAYGHVLSRSDPGKIRSKPVLTAPLRLGVLGLNRGSHFARAAAAVPHAAVVTALCARNRDRLATARSNLGIAADLFTDYEAMLASRVVDAVVVASAPAEHLAHTLAALDAGKHVLAEVPAVTQLADCRILLDRVRGSGLTYMLAENFCYMRTWSLVKELASAGILGTPVFGEGRLCARIRFQPPGPDARWSTAEWAMRPGHPYPTHYWGPLYQVFGEPLERLTCFGSGQHHLEWAAADDTAVVLGNTVSGKLVQLRVDFFSPQPTEGYIGLQTTGGSCRILSTGTAADQLIHIDGRTPGNTWESLWTYADHLDDRWQSVPAAWLDREYDSGLPLLIDDFARAARAGTRPPIDVIDALNMTAPIFAAEHARQMNGVPVPVPSFI